MAIKHGSDLPFVLRYILILISVTNTIFVVNGETFTEGPMNHINATLNQSYNKQVSNTAPMTFFYAKTTSGSNAVRVTLSSLSATDENPILVIVKRQRSVMSWQIPLVLEENHHYSLTSRTLCPIDNFTPDRPASGEIC